MEFIKLHDKIWRDNIHCTTMPAKSLYKLNLKKIALYAKEMGREERKSEMASYFIEDSLLWVENDLKSNEQPYYILFETGKKLPGCDSTKDSIKSYYLEKADVIGYYERLLEFMLKSCKNTKKDMASLFRIHVMIDLIYVVYQIDKGELKNYLLQIQNNLQGIDSSIHQPFLFVSLAHFIYLQLCGYLGFDFENDSLWEETKTIKK